MESNSKTTSVWTDEKHLHFLNTMEASFIRTMLHRYGVVSPPPLRLDRYLPDTSESTLDSKPNRNKPKKHASSDSMGPRPRRRKRRSSNHLQSSSAEQVISQLENVRENAACDVGGDNKEPTSNV